MHFYHLKHSNLNLVLDLTLEHQLSTKGSIFRGGFTVACKSWNCVHVDLCRNFDLKLQTFPEMTRKDACSHETPAITASTPLHSETKSFSDSVTFSFTSV